MKRTTIIDIIAILYIILFLYTGISKLIDYPIFKEQIGTSPLLAPVAKPIAALLPFLEFIVVLLIIIPRWRLKGFYMALFMMGLFTIYIIGILLFNKDLPCSCGGVLAELNWEQHILFNGAFMAMAIFGIKFQKKIPKNDLEDFNLTLFFSLVPKKVASFYSQITPHMKHLFIILIIAILFGCYGTEPEKTGKEGNEIPSFKLLLIDSLTYFDTKDIPIGKPSVLFYYGPHCPYSRAQMEEMMEEMNTMKNIQFYIFTAYPFSNMKAFYQGYHLNKFKNIISGRLNSTAFFTDYFKIVGVPFTAIYGKDRRLIKAFQGKIYSKQIIKALDGE